MTETITLPHDPRLGRTLVSLDPRSRDYPARALFGANLPLRNKVWSRTGAWDQGLTSQCVLYTVKGMIWTAPNRVQHPLPKRRAIDPGVWYPLAQKIDPWPGEAPTYEGTSVLAGIKTGQREGFYSGYRWCFGIDDVLQTLTYHGPIAIGVSWYMSMFETDRSGWLKVDTQSGLAGGHAVELHGLDVRQKAVIATNSWGPGWGVRGRFRIKWDDLEKLLHDNGEAVTVVP